MIKIELNDTVILTETETMIGSTPIKNNDIHKLADMMKDVGDRSTYLHMHTADVILASVLLKLGLSSCMSVTPINEGAIKGALVGTTIVLVNTINGQYGYYSVLEKSGLKGNLELKEDLRQQIENKVNKRVSVSFANITISRDGDKISIYSPCESTKAIYTNTFDNIVFKRLEDGWLLGGIMFSEDARQVIQKKINELFGYNEPKPPILEIEECYYRGEEIGINEKFAAVREKNKQLNACISENKREEVPKLFWDLFNARLMLLKARGFNIQEILESYRDYITECKKCNYKKGV